MLSMPDVFLHLRFSVTFIITTSSLFVYPSPTVFNTPLMSLLFSLGAIHLTLDQNSRTFSFNIFLSHRSSTIILHFIPSTVPSCSSFLLYCISTVFLFSLIISLTLFPKSPVMTTHMEVQVTHE